MDTRKWSAKWKNWNISDILLFEFNRGAKAVEGPETFASCMGTMPLERAQQEYAFLVRRIVLTLVTLHVQEDLRVLMKIV